MNNNFKKSPSRLVKSFSQNLFDTRDRVNKEYFIRNFSREDIRQVEEFCKIIADVLCLPENTFINIDSECLYTSVVQEVFSQLDERHIEFVLENFKKIGYQVKKSKSYIRTALYNSFFEIESRTSNDESVRFGND